MMEQTLLELGDGTEMPALGLGTWKSKPDEVYRAVRFALEVGYRHVDCAAIYDNEGEVGRAIDDAIRAGDVCREDLWVTSKLWNNAHLADDVRPAMEETLKDLRVDYLDLYLIHWPVAFRPEVTYAGSRSEFLTLAEAPLEATWEAMVELREEGLARQVGVSNMGPERIEALTEAAGPPAVDQVECHPHLQQRQLVEYCGEHGIAVTAYSPLGSPDRQFKGDDEPPLMGHPTIEEVAQDVGATAAQVLIAWSLNRGLSVIPKSVTPAYIEQNLGAIDVELGDEHMAAIAKLDKGFRYVDGTFFAGDESPYEVDDIWR